MLLNEYDMFTRSVITKQFLKAAVSKVAVTDMSYFVRSKFSRSLDH